MTTRKHRKKDGVFVVKERMEIERLGFGVWTDPKIVSMHWTEEGALSRARELAETAGAATLVAPGHWSERMRAGPVRGERLGGYAVKCRLEWRECDHSPCALDVPCGDDQEFCVERAEVEE